MKILLSGIQPTNKLTLGNYLGSIKKIVNNQDKYKTFLFVADNHILTVPLIYHHNPYSQLNSIVMNTMKMYLACGIKKSTIIFRQSDVKEHLELFYLLLTHTTYGELSRMTQYKDLSKKFSEPNGTEPSLMGLLIYPVLMAADILLYDTDYVAVGEDQKQHLELIENIVNRFNNKYQKRIFKTPIQLPENEEDIHNKIMDLQNPLKKMSKSSLDHLGTIFLSDTKEEIDKKIMKAKTDDLNHINYNTNTQPGVSNLVVIYSLINNCSINESLTFFNNKTYSELKKTLSECVWQELSKIQKNLITINEREMLETVHQNTMTCVSIAKQKMISIFNQFS